MMTFLGRRKSHCLVWGSLAAVLYASAAGPHPDVQAASPHPELEAALVQAEVALADLDGTIALAEPMTNVALGRPDANPGSLNISDDCPGAQDCIDQYLWSIYERTRKVDTIKVPERIRVTVKKKGKSRTVTKTVIKLVAEDFGWKDPKAAENAGMSVSQYVIGGMDRAFRLKLYRLLRALDAAGLEPGITSAFRDDYRQSIASGFKAASDRSYHGGTLRGGYGRGLAADLVSVKGANRSERWTSCEELWKWIDTNGQQFGIGRPYLDKDPPHVAPIDGKEYVDRRGSNGKRAALDAK